MLPRRSNPGFCIIAGNPVAAFTPPVQADPEVEKLCLAHLASTAKDASVVVTEIDGASQDPGERDILIGASRAGSLLWTCIDVWHLVKSHFHKMLHAVVSGMGNAAMFSTAVPVNQKGEAFPFQPETQNKEHEMQCV